MTTETNSLALANTNLDMSVLDVNGVGTIESYISAAYRMPMLTAEEEIELGQRMRDNSDIDAARKLIMSHLRLVISISRQYLGYGLSHADLIQEGNIGLMKAVRRFDPSRGVRLVSFAVHWIKAEIHEFVIRNWRLVKIATTKAQRKLFFNLRRMRPDGQTALDPDQISKIAEELNVRPQDVAEMEVRMSGGDTSFDVPLEDEDGFAPISYLSDEDQEPSQVLQRREYDKLQSTSLQNALADLDDRSRRIVQARWLQDEGNSTLHELAAEFGVSAERIRQIEVAAFKKLKVALS